MVNNFKVTDIFFASFQVDKSWNGLVSNINIPV